MTQNPRPKPTEYLGQLPDITTSPQSNPAAGVGQYEYYTGSLKEAMNNAGDANSPFSEAIREGWYSWQSGDDRIKLKEAAIDPSGAVKLTLANGWEGLFYVWTDNWGFFEDETSDRILSDWNPSDSWTNEVNEMIRSLRGEYPNIVVQEDDDDDDYDSRAVFLLSGAENDYVSIDMDGDHSNIGQMRIRIKGTQFVSNKETETDTALRMLFLRRWNPDLPSANPNPTPEPNPDPDPDPDPNNECPVGFEKDEFGICVPIKEPEPKECEKGFYYDSEKGECVPEKNPADDVSIAGMVALLGGVALTIYLALKVV